MVPWHLGSRQSERKKMEETTLVFYRLGLCRHCQHRYQQRRCRFDWSDQSLFHLTCTWPHQVWVSNVLFAILNRCRRAKLDSNTNNLFHRRRHGLNHRLGATMLVVHCPPMTRDLCKIQWTWVDVKRKWCLALLGRQIDWSTEQTWCLLCEDAHKSQRVGSLWVQHLIRCVKLWLVRCVKMGSRWEWQVSVRVNTGGVKSRIVLELSPISNFVWDLLCLRCSTRNVLQLCQVRCRWTKITTLSKVEERWPQFYNNANPTL